MSLFKFGELEKEIDFTDPDIIDLIEVEDERARNEAKNASPIGKASDRIRALSAIYDRFFDTVIGAGSSTKMFGANKSYIMRVDAYNAFCNAINQETVEINNIAAQKFVPSKPVNRQQRRKFNKNNRR